jgi:hypothetical protein
MIKLNQISDSSNGLEACLNEPLRDVSLIIVHVNQHYDSFNCCEEQLSKLLKNRVALNVYEHVAWYQSFLQSNLGLDFDTTKRNTNIRVNGVNYHLINNETRPGDYNINDLNGDRFIIVGGGIGRFCHGSATKNVIDQLFLNVEKTGIKEIHLPLDLLYETQQKSESG